MKKIILSLVLLAASSFSIAQKAADIGAQINQQVLMTQNDLATFKKVEKVNNAQGYNYQYFKGKELQMIEVKTVEPSVMKQVNLYFSNGKMIYSETQWISNSGDLVFSEKYYLTNGKLVRWTKDGKDVDPNDQQFKDAETKIVQSGKKARQEASQ
jgi:hypothetical protein